MIAAGASRHGRLVPSTLRAISPAPSSTFKCRETAGCVMSNGSAISVTVASPRVRRARIALRVGSANAVKAALRLGMVRPSYITNQLYNKSVKVKSHCAWALAPAAGNARSSAVAEVHGWVDGGMGGWGDG